MHDRPALKSLSLVFTCLAVIRSAWAGAVAPPSGRTPPQIQAFRLSGAVRVDGILDEADWRRPSNPPLIQNEPDNNASPREATEWWLAYDDDAVYLACRMHDAAPESIRCGLGRRDTWPNSDWITLGLDTFNDDRTGFEFALSPAGATVDAAFYEDGNEDLSWDGIWNGAARVDSLGWTAEMRIPFSQLRYPDQDDLVWGINLTRNIFRTQERDDLMPRPRGASGYESRFPDIVGIRGIRSRRHLELLAYGLSRNEARPLERGDPFRSRSALSGSAGADLKWGISNKLTVNATVNPDFGQVEVDPAVVNLSDSETYLDEKRPFFVEDQGSFRFGHEGTNSTWNFNFTDPILFYSRRVGQSPQVSLPDHDFSDAPGNTTILGAGRIDGRMGRTTVAALGAVTGRETARISAGGIRSRLEVEPPAGYGVVRALRARPDGRRGVGLIATGTWRDVSDSRARSELGRQALVWGADGWTRLDQGDVWAVRGYVSGSLVSGSAAALDRLQTDSHHYFQRPDARQLHHDPTRTSMSGVITRAVLNKQSGAFALNASAGAVSPGYEADDLGYTNRSDVINWSLVTGYKWLNPTRRFRYHDVYFATYNSWDTGGNPDNYGYGVFWNATAANYWWGSGNVFYNPNRQVLRATRGGPAMRAPAVTEIVLSLGSDSRKMLTGQLDATASKSADASNGWSADLQLTARPRTSVSFSLVPAYSYSMDHSGWVNRIDDPAMTATYGARYLFSRLTYRETSLATRIDWTFTPRLTLQGYIQPLIGVGSYRDFMELARPRSYSFHRYGVDGGSSIAYDASGNEYVVDPDGAGPLGSFTFGNPDFNYKSLKVNLVLRWEYQAGSTFFLVWTQSRTDDQDPGDFRFGRDVRSLFRSGGENVVVMKLSKWMGL